MASRSYFNETMDSMKPHKNNGRHSGAPRGARQRAAANPEPMNTVFEAVLIRRDLCSWVRARYAAQSAASRPGMTAI
jgi:hypothetical protein